jgi:hypothetical protein
VYKPPPLCRAIRLDPRGCCVSTINGYEAFVSAELANYAYQCWRNEFFFKLCHLGDAVLLSSWSYFFDVFFLYWRFNFSPKRCGYGCCF